MTPHIDKNKSNPQSQHRVPTVGHNANNNLHSKSAAQTAQDTHTNDSQADLKQLPSNYDSDWEYEVSSEGEEDVEEEEEEGPGDYGDDDDDDDDNDDTPERAPQNNHNDDNTSDDDLQPLRKSEQA